MGYATPYRLGPPPPPFPSAPPPPAGRGRWAPLLIFVGVLTAFLVVVGTVAALTRPDRERDRPDTAGLAGWDPRVLFAVRFVEDHKGAPFRRPVTVNFLPDAEFEAELAAASARGEDEDRPADDAATAAAVLRALGLARGDFDPDAQASALAASGVLAYYEPRAERVWVRGTELDVTTRSTLVHELTHAWQDQHHDIEHVDDLPDSEARAAFRAVVEGDASNTDDAWVETLDADEQERFEELSRRASDEAQRRTPGVPTVMAASTAAPYVLGGALLRGLGAIDGPDAIEDAFVLPPDGSDQLLQPWRYLDERIQEPVSVGPVPGERAELDTDRFGALSLYLLLADRMDPHEALAAADGWTGDQYRVARRTDGRVCTAAQFATADAAGRDRLERALGAWDAAFGGGDVEIVTRPATVGFVACDPGPAALYTVPDRSERSLGLPVVRVQVWALWMEESGGDETASRCYGQAFADAVTDGDLDDQATARDERRSGELWAAARRACR